MSSFVHSIRFRTAAMAVSLLVGGLLSSCGKAPKQTLRLDLVPGNSYVLSVRVTSDAILTSADGNTIPVPATSLSTFILQAGDIDERGDTFISAEVGNSEFPLVFVPLATIFKGYTFGFKLSPIGRISEFVNTDAMRQGIRESLLALDTVPAADGSTSVESALALISDDALRAMIEPVTSIWPEAPVSPGDEWTGPAIYSPNGHLITTASFRLESQDDAEWVISVKTDVQPAKERERDPNIPPLSETSGQGSGTIRIDPARGTIRSYEVNQETAGTFRNADGAEFDVTRSSRIQAELTAR